VFTLDLQELAIVIAVQQLDPTLLSSEFLRYSNIVPPDWQLAQRPIRSPQMAQVSFQNGVSLIIQPDRLTLVEPLLGKSADAVQVAAMAQRCLNVLPNLDYQGLGINTRTLRVMPGPVEQVSSYLSQHLLSGGEWMHQGTVPVRMGLNLSYTFEQSRLTLSVYEAIGQLPEEQPVAVVVFSGNFDYELGSDASKLERLEHLISAWPTDLEQFCELVNRFPQSAALSLVTVA
jgi:hypothetical protein